MKNLYLFISLSMLIFGCVKSKIDDLPKKFIYTGEVAKTIGVDSIGIVYNQNAMADSILIYEKGQMVQFNKLNYFGDTIKYTTHAKRRNWAKDDWHYQLNFKDGKVVKYSSFKNDTLTLFDSLIYNSQSNLSESFFVYVDIYSRHRMPPEYISKFTYDSTNNINKTLIYTYDYKDKSHRKIEEITYERSPDLLNFYYGNEYLFFLLEVNMQKSLGGEMFSKNLVTKITSSKTGEVVYNYETVNGKIVSRIINRSKWNFKY